MAAAKALTISKAGCGSLDGEPQPELLVFAVAIVAPVLWNAMTETGKTFPLSVTVLAGDAPRQLSPTGRAKAQRRKRHLIRHPAALRYPKNAAGLR